MNIVLLGLASVTFIYLLFTLFECVVGFNAIKNLTKQTLLPNQQLPSVSIIFSALNEEAMVEQTIKALLTLNYPRLEIIAINDRSTDKTPEILNALQQQYPQLRVFHIQTLPAGWLGKNYALYFGAMQAKGEWLLFTDADVVMRGPILEKTLSYAIENHVDHVTIFENHLRNQLGLKILLLGSYVAYSMNIKPWRIRYRWSKKYLGHGAFNLVKKTSYLDCGGHQAIALECLDDMELGHILKRNGYQQDVVDGRDYLEREWYSSAREMIKGLQKNSFAHFNFQLRQFLSDFCLAVIFFIWPFLACYFFSGPIFWLNVTNIFLTFLLSAYIARHFRLEKRFAFLYPVSMIMLFYTLWSSVITTYKNKGVIWRDTFYPLAILKNKNTH